jgi:hypothetical protein
MTRLSSATQWALRIGCGLLIAAWAWAALVVLFLLF